MLHLVGCLYCTIVSVMPGHTNIKLPFSLYIPVVLVPYLLARNWYWYIYLTANGLTPGGSSTATFTHKQYTEYKERNTHSNHKMWSVKCGPCPVCASYTLAFALQLRKKHGKTSVRVQYKNHWTTKEQYLDMERAGVRKGVDTKMDYQLQSDISLDFVFRELIRHFHLSSPSGL